MRIAFYAPLKPPDWPVPSGDRLLARMFITALCDAGHDVRVASRLRAFEGTGDVERQAAIKVRGQKIAQRLIASYGVRRPAPDLWFTYHLYHKAPDWIGPAVSDALAIPYVLAEASFASKQAGGPWAEGHSAVQSALTKADLVICLNSTDRPCLLPEVRNADVLHTVAPFADLSAFAAARPQRDALRRALSERTGSPTDEPWLITAAMMRHGDKLRSYTILANALRRVMEHKWRLLVAGDGEARHDVAELFNGLDDRVHFLGRQARDELAASLAASDLFVWPAVREALGMVIIEAQAAGVPVVVGDSGDTARLFVPGETGVLVEVLAADSFADGIVRGLETFFGDVRVRDLAAENALDRHGLDQASAKLDALVRSVVA